MHMSGPGSAISGKKVGNGIRWLACSLVACNALVLASICWQAKVDWQGWIQYKRGHGPISQLPSETVAWRQAVLPAQYSQASCGSCHRGGVAETPRLNHGRQLLTKFNCIGCHRLQGTSRPAMLGPDLTSVGTKVTREWIYKWLKEPRTLMNANGNVALDGVYTEPRMPAFRLSEIELRALSAYLSIQRVDPVAIYRFNSRAVSLANRTGDAAEQGQIRFNQMFCITCHALAVDRGGETTLIGGDIGPELTKVGSKVNPEWLVAWLRDPQNYLAHTNMPQYQWTDEDLYSVSQYLLKRLTDPGLLKDVPQLGQPTEPEVQLGRRLFIEKGCAECHAIQGVKPRDNFGPDLSGLGLAAGPYLEEVKFVGNQPSQLHFVPKGTKQIDVSVAKVPRFMISYIQAKITNPASLSRETHMPQFHMSQSDLDDLTIALLSMNGGGGSNKYPAALTVQRSQAEFHPAGRAGELYLRFKCYVCHTFNGTGGTLAPDLSFEGSRSQHEWLVQFLLNPQTLRPTLTVRMPHFNMSEQDANTLADYLSGSLQNPKVPPRAVDERDLTPEMAVRGRQLFERKYACQSCHTIGSSGGYVGPSLNNAGNWLTAAWIEAWLRDPQALVPGVIEPQQTITEDDIKAITAYLMTLKQAPADKRPTAAGGGL